MRHAKQTIPVPELVRSYSPELLVATGNARLHGLLIPTVEE
jgi:hypothetical protein